MTTIIKTNGVLSAPAAGTAVLPALGLSGILAYWAAASASAAVGSAVISVPNSIAGAPALSITAGTPTARSTSNRRWIDLAVGTTNQLDAAGDIAIPATLTIAVLAKWTALPTGLQQIIAAAGSSGAVSIDTSGRALTYGNGGSTYPTSAAISLNTWHRIIGVVNGNSSSITVDGVTTVGSGVNLTPAPGKPRIKGTSQMGFGVVAAVVLDHAATTQELATIDAALTALIPA